MDGNGGKSADKIVQPVTGFNVVALVVAALEKGPRDMPRGTASPCLSTITTTTTATTATTTTTTTTSKRLRSDDNNNGSNSPPPSQHPLHGGETSTPAAPQEIEAFEANVPSSIPSLPRRRRRPKDPHPAPVISSPALVSLPHPSFRTFPHAEYSLPRSFSSVSYESQTPPPPPPPPPSALSRAVEPPSCWTLSPSSLCVSPTAQQTPPSSSSHARLPDAVVEVILDHLPLPRALSMVVRSRAGDRSVSCSKYALSRMDKMVAGLAAAEQAFHLADKSMTDENKSTTKEEAKREQPKTNNINDDGDENDDQNHDDHNGDDTDHTSRHGGDGKEPTHFFQLGDLSHLDLVYKLALDLARKQNPTTCGRGGGGGGDNKPEGDQRSSRLPSSSSSSIPVAGAGAALRAPRSALTSCRTPIGDGDSDCQGGGSGVDGVGGGWGASSTTHANSTSGESSIIGDDSAWSAVRGGGNGPEWSRPGPSAERAWRVGRRLMDLLATGMVANLRMRVLEDSGGRTPEVGIVTDCMHPTASGNRHFRFRDSVDVCGLLGFDRFPLVVISGICVLNTESPIFACLPGVEAVPIRFTPTGPADGSRGGIGDDIGDRDGNKAGVNLDPRGVRGGCRAAGGGRQGGEGPSERPDAAWIEKYDGLLFQSRATGALASIARTYASLCGRYTAALVRFRQSSGHLEGRHHPQRSSPGRMWASETRAEIARLSFGVGPCASPFCRSWDVPSYTLVIFRHQSQQSSEPDILQTPGRIVRSSGHGGWTFADVFHGIRLHHEWCRLLGV